MLRAYVLGHPVAHSLSPTIYTFFAQKSAVVDFDYQRKDIPPEALVSEFEVMASCSEVIGANVTVPHKERILSVLDGVTEEVQSIGAVNVIQRDGQAWVGHNTDAAGFYRVLQHRSFPFRGARVLMLGAGGAARAALHVLVREGVAQVDVINRSVERAQQLVQDFSRVPGTQITLQSLTTEPYDLCINTTALGIQGKDATVKDYFLQSCLGVQFNARSIIFDLVYSGQPGMRTPFLEVMQQQFAHVTTQVDGLEMLIEQAVETWRIWFGETIEPEWKGELIALLRERPIFLTGFMGVGKSTVGALLAQELGYHWIDLDREIEKETGLSIAEIFQQGESAFREIEHRVFLRHVWTSRSVIALGGGSLTHSGTRRIVHALGRSVYLSARIETLQQRLKMSHERPLLSGPMGKSFEAIQAILSSREAQYEEAICHIQTDVLTPRQVVQNVILALYE